MPLSDKHLAILREIQAEWDRAEEDIKLAEQVGNAVVFPSIKELRYAGRRIVDMIVVMLEHPEDQKKIDDLLADARFDCHRARHDAVDAATADIAAQLVVMVKHLTYEAILPAYPEFPALYRDLRSARDRIAGSRGKRKDREAIYSAIEATDLVKLVGQYNDLMACEPIMKTVAKSQRRERLISRWGLIIGVILGVGGIIVGFFT